MAHPNVSKRSKNKLWHLEDSKLKLVEARSLKKHLIKTEGKKARYNRSKDGYQVWWARG